MTKLDLKKDLKHLYNPSAKTPALVDVPAMRFLMIDGSGDPVDSPAFQAATEALYAVAYALKFMCKTAPDLPDYTVMPLEGLWWAANMAEFRMDVRDNWLWTLMIVQPDHIRAEMVDRAVAEAGRKKDLPALPDMRFETYAEGLAAQIMHIGPYAAEGPTVAGLHAWITAQGFTLEGAGKHHEIYLSDPRRVAPDKMKTVIRQPVVRPEA